MFLKVLRNVVSILIGLIMYFIMERLLSLLFLFLLKIPVLSFLMTGYVPVDIFLNASVATSATFATVFVMRLVSSYKSVNYSVVIVFSILLLIYIVSLVYRISTIGFKGVNLTASLIYIVTFIIGCFMANEDET